MQLVIREFLTRIRELAVEGIDIMRAAKQMLDLYSMMWTSQRQRHV